MSSQNLPQYRLTPSLLNKFQDLLDSDLNWQKFYADNDNSTVTAEEYYAKCEQELLDACNRVPFTSEAASRGTALNEIVDCILDRRPPREDMKVERLFSLDPCKPELIGLRAELDGFSFLFDINLIDELADYFHDAVCQYRCEATLDTSFGPVILYGDLDYLLRDVVHDLKTTSRYDYGKFEHGWQKHVYPWALIKSGDVTAISGFEYTVVPLTGGTERTSMISGEINREWYDFDFESSEKKLREIVEPFVQWIEAHRELIVHPRIFNKI